MSEPCRGCDKLVDVDPPICDDCLNRWWESWDSPEVDESYWDEDY